MQQEVLRDLNENRCANVGFNNCGKKMNDAARFQKVMGMLQDVDLPMPNLPWLGVPHHTEKRQGRGKRKH
jgi:hypothetical protein